LFGDFDGLIEVADLEGGVDANDALDFDGDVVADEAAEAGLFDFDAVLAWGQVDELVVAAGVGPVLRRVTLAWPMVAPEESLTVPTMEP
jgi:hypothetical protein